MHNCDVRLLASSVELQLVGWFASCMTTQCDGAAVRAQKACTKALQTRKIFALDASYTRLHKVRAMVAL